MINLKKIIQPYDVIFIDIDNTICNYTYAHNAAITKVMREFSITKDEYKLAKLNIKKRDLRANHHKKELYFKNITEIKGLKVSDTLQMYDMYQTTFDQNLLVDSSIVDMLNYAKLSNKKIVAITNFYIIAQIKKLMLMGVIDCFDYLITSEEFELEKPNKKLFEHARLLSGNPDLSKIIMFGDSVVDDMSLFGVKYYPYNCSKMLISISGKSGSGKSTISEIVRDTLDATVIEGDGYHKYERTNPIWNSLTHYNPRCNNLIQLGMDVKKIYQDIEKIKVPIYNHISGRLDDAVVVDHSKLDVVIIEGLHTLYPEVTGDFVKLKIFIDNEHSNEQKIDRDIKQRNANKDTVIKNINRREVDYDKYIAFQREFSNFLIEIKNNEFTISITDDIIIPSLKYLNGVATIVGEYDSLNSKIVSLIQEIQDNRYTI